MKPQVSILIPVYGVEKFIERCAISLFEQTFQDIEYIFVNDCTPDNSIHILLKTLEKYPNRKNQVKIINHESNRGLAAARNTAVDNASCDYIMHVDSDDYLELNAIELLYEKSLEENADIVVCDFQIECDDVSKTMVIDIGENKTQFIKRILSLEPTGLFAKLIRKSIYIQNNIKAKEGVNLAEDFMAMVKLCYHANHISKVNSSLYHYVKINTNSYTAQKWSKKNNDNVIFVTNNITAFLEEKPDFHIYKETMLQGVLIRKIDMLFFADREYLNELNTLFPETDAIKEISFLSKRDKIGHFLLKRNYINLFYIFRKMYHTYSNIKRRIITKSVPQNEKE